MLQELLSPPTRREKETAIRVLIRSSAVRKWVTKEAQFLKVDLDTPAGERFYMEHARRMALRMIK